MIQQLRLGKTPARPGAVKLKFRSYLKKLPPFPHGDFGHEKAVPTWGMLGNDKYGDCVLAGGIHETMLWLQEGGKPYGFSTEAALKNYTEVTGFDPSQTDANGDNPTDQGTDMELAAKYRRTTGLLDAAGKRHKIEAYLALTPGDLQEHLCALYYFGAVGVGIRFPNSAMDQFNEHKPWTVVRGSGSDGDHYIPLVGHRHSRMNVVTWGRLQMMTTTFFGRYNDESIVYLGSECFGPKGCNAEGFNLDQLRDDLAQITR
jgi:hypothetical protein